VTPAYLFLFFFSSVCRNFPPHDLNFQRAPDIAISSPQHPTGPDTEVATPRLQHRRNLFPFLEQQKSSPLRCWTAFSSSVSETVPLRPIMKCLESFPNCWMCIVRATKEMLLFPGPCSWQKLTDLLLYGVSECCWEYIGVRKGNNRMKETV
jgi:hypothetical protein